MNDIILRDERGLYLEKDAYALLIDLERRIKELKKIQEETRERLLEEMELKGIKKVDTPMLSITYKASYDKESFETKRFREEHPDLYDEYIKISSVKPSVQIEVKENE